MKMTEGGSQGFHPVWSIPFNVFVLNAWDKNILHSSTAAAATDYSFWMGNIHHALTTIFKCLINKIIHFGFRSFLKDNYYERKPILKWAAAWGTE